MMSGLCREVDGRGEQGLTGSDAFDERRVFFIACQYSEGKGSLLLALLMKKRQ